MKRSERKEQNRQYYAANREREKVRHKEYYDANRERILAQKKEYLEANREARRERWRQRYRATRDICLEQARRYREANRENTRVYFREHHKANPGLYRAKSARHKAQKILATPTWSEREQITALYEFAAGMGYHVDHIVPLRGKTVCGLHVLANLDVVRGEVNMAKSNLWWPDMWAEK